MSDEHKPVSAWDVSDDNPDVISRHLRIVQSELRDGFESIRIGLDRINDRLDHLVDDVAEIRRELNDHERRIRALETAHRKRKAT
jgi:septal ring factor EnvC (AmiA/AmiB activator)